MHGETVKKDKDIRYLRFLQTCQDFGVKLCRLLYSYKHQHFRRPRCLAIQRSPRRLQSKKTTKQWRKQAPPKRPWIHTACHRQEEWNLWI